MNILRGSFTQPPHYAFTPHFQELFLTVEPDRQEIFCFSWTIKFQCSQIQPLGPILTRRRISMCCYGL
jgi:hypothetical protein